MKKVDLIAKLAEVTGKTKKETTETIDALLGIITETLKNGEDVTLTGYFGFEVKDTPARKGRNPKTGEELDVPEGKKVKVKIGKFLKDAVRG